MSSAPRRTSPSQRIPEPTLRQRWVWGFQCAFILAVIWLALTGIDALALGLIAIVAGGVFGAVVVPGNPYPWRALRLLRFVLYFLRASIMGGIDVAWRALTPTPAIQPGWLRYRMQLPPGQPRTMLVSVLSLLPGTLSADLEADDVLLVHGLAADDAASLQAAVQELEEEIAWFFSLPVTEAESR